MTRFVSVDFTNIAPPDIIETLDFEVIRAQIIADFQGRYPEFDVPLMENNAISMLLETVAYRELQLRARVNDAARAVMMPLATGNDLNNLAALYKIARKDGEEDADFRQRIHLHIEAFATAGPRGAYIYHALDAAPTLLDANAVATEPGYVRVVLLGAADGVPTSEELVAIRERLLRDDIRPLTDVVSVEAVTLVPVDVEATLVLLPGPDASLVLQQATAAVTTLLNTRKKVGRNLSRSAILSALHVEGVERVLLTSPAADVIIEETEAVRAGNVVITVDGTRDE
ncbi:MAG: baseplate J/gp47 family protein [Devosia sp.]